jgi:hypothetical protein
MHVSGRNVQQVPGSPHWDPAKEGVHFEPDDIDPGRGVSVKQMHGSNSVTLIRTASMGDQLLTAIDQKQRTHRCQVVWDCWNYAFRPSDGIRVGWDVFMLVLVIYSCFALPYKTAFVLEVRFPPGIPYDI